MVDSHCAQELMQIWIEYNNSKELKIRNQLITEYSSLVKQVVNRLGSNYKSYMQIEDLISYGNLGLIDAVEKYDIAKGVKFETYASIRIRGSIIDHIRKQDWIPRNLRHIAKNTEKAIIELESKLGRTATIKEVADYLSVTEQEVEKTLEQIHTFTIISLDDQIIDAVNYSFLDSNNNQIGNPENQVLEDEVKDILTKAIEGLAEREQTIVSLYYFDELTLKEIGLVLGISESRVSQLHSRALLKLRSALGDMENVF